ncbi:MAG: BlaI/MecI/CopY family transcriptional regulator [bacterium]
MSGVPKISEAEWEVMKVIWEKSPVTAQDVIGKLGDRMEWSPRTIKTLLGRLVKKGALKFEAQGKSYLYRPGVAMDKCVKVESESFVDRVFGGAAAPMLVHFVKNAKLSPGDIRELRKILEEKKQ